MKANKFIKKCGPFKVSSISQDAHGVRMVVYPAFPEYEEFSDGVSWAIHRQDSDGGGPSIFTSIALAKEMEKFLNQPYDDASIIKWGKTLNKMFKHIKKRDKQ